MDRTFMFMKKYVPRGLSAPIPGLYNIYMTIIFKAPIPGLYNMYMTIYSNTFFSETAWQIKAKLYVEHR